MNAPSDCIEFEFAQRKQHIEVQGLKIEDTIYHKRTCYSTIGALSFELQKDHEEQLGITNDKPQNLWFRYSFWRPEGSLSIQYKVDVHETGMRVQDGEFLEVHTAKVDQIFHWGPLVDDEKRSKSRMDAWKYFERLQLEKLKAAKPAEKQPASSTQPEFNDEPARRIEGPEALAEESESQKRGELTMQSNQLSPTPPTGDQSMINNTEALSTAAREMYRYIEDAMEKDATVQVNFNKVASEEFSTRVYSTIDGTATCTAASVNPIVEDAAVRAPDEDGGSALQLSQTKVLTRFASDNAVGAQGVNRRRPHGRRNAILSRPRGGRFSGGLHAFAHIPAGARDTEETEKESIAGSDLVTNGSHQKVNLAANGTPDKAKFTQANTGKNAQGDLDNHGARKGAAETRRSTRKRKTRPPLTKPGTSPRKRPRNKLTSKSEPAPVFPGLARVEPQ